MQTVCRLRFSRELVQFAYWASQKSVKKADTPAQPEPTHKGAEAS